MWPVRSYHAQFQAIGKCAISKREKYLEFVEIGQLAGRVSYAHGRMIHVSVTGKTWSRNVSCANAHGINYHVRIACRWIRAHSP